MIDVWEKRGKASVRVTIIGREKQEGKLAPEKSEKEEDEEC